MIIYDKYIAELREYDNNPRNNENAVAAVAASIKEFGFKVPIVIDAAGVIIAGHTRVKAAQRLGLQTVPCIVADDLTEEQIRAFRLADNKVGELAGWDFDKLDAELEALAEMEIDMTAFGFDDLGLDDPQEIIEDEAPEVDEESEPRCKLGDIWQLGRHRLMCGDSTDPLNVKLLLQGKKADLLFTDPPYGMKKESDGVANDNLNYDDLLEFNKQWIPITFDALKENGSWYCWGIDEPLMDIYSHILKPMARQNLITYRNLITWDKGNGQGQMSENHRCYARADEKCLFVMCGVQGFNNNADNYFEAFEPIRKYLVDSKKAMGWSNADLQGILGKSTFTHYFAQSQWEFPTEEAYKKMQAAASGDAFKREYDEIKREYDEIKREYYDTRAYFNNTHDNMNNVWKFTTLVAGTQERKDAGGHATPKPIALCSRAIMSSSREGESVLDVFGGSGSTLIACEQLQRTAYVMELEPKWCDVIIKRWETLTGETARLL